MPAVDHARVAGLFAKVTRGEPMVRVDYLDLDPARGVAGSTHPAPRSPRQVCLVAEDSLRACDVKPDAARVNVVLGGGPVLASGTLLRAGGATIRVTFACEPCAHGAQLADTPMRRFRSLDRCLGVVVHAGQVGEGDAVTSTPRVFPAWAGDFRGRARQAVDLIPAGRAVTSLEFLVAIGAGPSYARALPRWLHTARAAGGPVHRVLTAGMEAPSWAPDALVQLAAEVAGPAGSVPYGLVEALWFGG